LGTEGVKLFSSHEFREAKEKYVEAVKLLIIVKKLTLDDEAFNEKIKARINLFLEKAEACKA